MKIIANERRLVLFVSNTNAYINPCNKIIEICNLDTIIINIEDYYNEVININLNEKDIIYFTCCNSLIVSQTIKKIRKEFKCQIINEKALSIENILSKKNLQFYLYTNSINVPKIYLDINSVKFPIFCKEQSHQGFTAEIYNRKSLNCFFQKFDISKFYLEEALSTNNSMKTNFKVYYVNGKIYTKDGTIRRSSNVEKICRKISLLLGDLEVFSIDLIKFQKKLWVIDINICTCLYLCDRGRKDFIKYIERI